MDERYYEGFWKRKLNQFIVSILKGLSHLPFFIHYFFSDLLYLFIRYVIRYRRKVIKLNLKNSFPEKSEREIALIIRKYYRHLCDLMVESIKIYSINPAEHKRRMRFNNLEIFEKYYEEGRSVVLVGMHFNNWEWTSLLPSQTKMSAIVIYNPVRGNKAFEDFLLRFRSKYNSTLVPVHKSSRILIDFSKSTVPKMLGLLADQSPHSNSKSWIRFLNQETAFFSGPEKIAFHSGFPTVFQHVKKIRRGYYEVFHYMLYDSYEGVESKDILISYARKMEEIIRENPEYYLWSHRRWKHKRPANIPMLDEEKEAAL
jgi:KDO2-lipid IV(A) lauroyltransferase